MSVTTTKDTRSALGERLEALCADHDLTLTELAERLEVNRTTLYHWRSGRHLPSAIVTLAMLADIFGVSTDWLLGRTDRRRPG